ncbi:MAG: M48 family metalloprotease [Phycisphaerales bacterium]
MTIKRLLLTIAFLLGSMSQVGCSINPATGKRSLTLMSWEQEKALGLSAAPQFTEQFGGAFPDANAQAYVDRIGAKLVAQIEPGVPDLEWEFTLLDSEVINAFALPGGKVFMTRGLAAQLSNEAEMAGVLGHEVGHVTARHANQRMSTQKLFNFGLGIGAVSVAASDSDSSYRKYGQISLPVVAVGGNLTMLKFGRDEESEADMLGMRYMSKAGYDPRAQRRVMEVLMQAGANSERQPEWLATHPYPETRIRRIDEIVATTYSDADSNPSYRLDEQAYQQNILAPLGSNASIKRTDEQTISAAIMSMNTCCSVNHK